MTGTVVLPPQPASPFRPPGDPVAARELAGSLLGAGALLDDRHGWVATDAVGPVGWEPGCSGPASEAYAAHVRPTGAALAAGAVALRSAASAADAYADALESLRRRGEELADRHVTLRFAVTSFADEARCTLAGEVTADVVALLQDEARRLRGEVEMLATDSALLRADTLAAEDAFTAVLRRYAGAEATARALATTGGQDPALHIALARAGTGADGHLSWPLTQPPAGGPRSPPPSGMPPSPPCLRWSAPSTASRPEPATRPTGCCWTGTSRCCRPAVRPGG